MLASRPRICYRHEELLSCFNDYIIAIKKDGEIVDSQLGLAFHKYMEKGVFQFRIQSVCCEREAQVVAAILVENTRYDV